MKNLILCICLIFAMSCSTNKSKTKKSIESIDTPVLIPESAINTFIGPINMLEPYGLKLKVHQLNSIDYDLDIQMLLYNNAHFISPNAKRDFLGKFTVFIEDTNNFKLQGNLIETPLSTEEIDTHPFTNGTVNWVRVDTNYKQQLQVTTQEDFQVFGYLQFTIEPRCSLEKIPFIIESENGKLKFELNNC